MNRERIEEAIAELDNYPVSEDANTLINYLRANIDDLEETLAD